MAVYTDATLNSGLGIAASGAVVLAVVSMPDGSVQLQWLEALWRPVAGSLHGEALGSLKSRCPSACVVVRRARVVRCAGEANERESKAPNVAGAVERTGRSPSRRRTCSLCTLVWRLTACRPGGGSSQPQLSAMWACLWSVFRRSDRRSWAGQGWRVLASGCSRRARSSWHGDLVAR